MPREAAGCSRDPEPGAGGWWGALPRLPGSGRAALLTGDATNSGTCHWWTWPHAASCLLGGPGPGILAPLGCHTSCDMTLSCGCLWPLGMTCQPAGTTHIKLLAWHCLAPPCSSAPAADVAMATPSPTCSLYPSFNVLQLIDWILRIPAVKSWRSGHRGGQKCGPGLQSLTRKGLCYSPCSAPSKCRPHQGHIMKRP